MLLFFPGSPVERHVHAVLRTHRLPKKARPELQPFAQARKWPILPKSAGSVSVAARENPHCAQRSAVKSHVDPHERTNTGEKPLQCPICPKHSYQKGEVAIRERICTGEKPYQCLMCLKWFNVKSNFAGHEHSHTGEKPYLPMPNRPKRFAEKNKVAIRKRTLRHKQARGCTAS